MKLDNSRDTTDYKIWHAKSAELEKCNPSNTNQLCEQCSHNNDFNPIEFHGIKQIGKIL